MTPAGTSMGEIDAGRIARLEDNGDWANGDKPTKESSLYIAMYQQRFPPGV